MDNKTQNEMLLDYLKSGNSITQAEAMAFFGIHRLSARIWDLKKDGYNIKYERVEENGRLVSVYRLKRSTRFSLWLSSILSKLF